VNKPTETRVGLVGAGYVSPYHIRALQTLPHVRIVGIADVKVQRASDLAQRFGIPRACAGLSDMADLCPDVVHILTPPGSHAHLAIEALQLGCHVLVEKPMAPTVEECDAMIAAAIKANRVLSVNHSARHDPVVIEALDLIRAGVCGDVLAVDVHRSSDYPPYGGGELPAAFRHGGYPFQDLGVHALTLMEAFLGPIRHVDARYESTGKHSNVFFDQWRGTVRCTHGSGAFYLSWAARPIRNELFIRGTRGDLHVDCFLQTCRVHKSLPGPKPITAGLNTMIDAAHTLYDVPRNIGRFLSGSLRPSPGIHAGVLQFHAVLAGQHRALVTAEEARRVIAWLEPICRNADVRRDQELRLHESLEPTHTLVTGASGLLGGALLARLRATGDRIRVLVRRQSPELERLPNVQVVYGDLGDPEAVDRAVEGVRVVYHVGAGTRGRGWTEFEGSTVSGTANIVHACVKHHVERLVYVSSLAVLDYARQSRKAIVDEHAPIEPHPERRGSYTRAKVQAERLVLEALRENGLQAVIVRPGQIVGPGYQTVAPYGTIAVAGRWIGVGLGRLKLPLVHVDDVVDGLLAAATRPNVCGAIFHLVDPTPVRQRDYIDTCRQEMDVPVRVRYVPRIVLFAAASTLEAIARLLGRSVPLTRYRIRSIRELTFDCSAARRRLGWEARAKRSPKCDARPAASPPCTRTQLGS